MPELRIYSETLSYDQIVRPRTVALLARYGLELVLAVRPGQTEQLPRLARTLGDAGVTLSLWPMLGDADGRWANVGNAAAFVGFGRSVVDTLFRHGGVPRDVLFDLEPPLGDARMLLPRVSRDWRGLLERATQSSRGRVAQRPEATRSAPTHLAAEEHLSRWMNDLHDRGVATSMAVWPLVALDPPGARAWQTMLGTPVDGLPARRISVMVYTSILEGWSRGTVRRGDARALLYAASRRVLRRWGERASISLGCVGTGAFEDEPIYRCPAELADDVALARAAGVEDLALFDLGGVMAREPAEAWLDAFTARREPPLLSHSRRVVAAQRLARMATWALARR